jgi:putative aldouronate transport system permease protein
VAFKKFNIFKGIWDSPWVGLANFKEAFGSKNFWSALKNTLILNIGDLIIGFPIPIFLAVFLNELRSSKVRKVTQTLLYLPNFLSWVIISGIVTQLFSNSGLVNNLINALGGNSVAFLSNTFLWRIVYWFMGVWNGAGYSLIVYLAALMATDASLGEAAYIDGATRLQRIWHVTLPQISSTVTVLLIMQVGKLVNISFDRPYMMGNTLVKDASEVISTYVYSVGLAAGRFDFATAVGLFQTVVGVVLVMSANAIIKKMGQEGIM